MTKNKKKIIILSGGGTLGSVTPLIAIKQEMEDKFSNEYSFLFVGTHDGVERAFVEKIYGIQYLSISSGKIRRYFSLKNFSDIFLIFKGFFDALKILRNYDVSCIVTAGSFVSVPLIFAAYFKKVSIVVHQLDIKIGLANKIMSRFADLIMVTFGDHVSSFGNRNILLSGTPVRRELFIGSIDKAKEYFAINNALKVIVVLGGGLGAGIINKYFWKYRDILLKKYNIIHVVGNGKIGDMESYDSDNGVYRVFEFIGGELSDAFALADCVITRAGLATLSELLVLGKVICAIPITNHQQEDNAVYLERKNALLVINESMLESGDFLNKIDFLMNDIVARDGFSKKARLLGNPHASSISARNIHKLIENKKPQ